MQSAKIIITNICTETAFHCLQKLKKILTTEWTWGGGLKERELYIRTLETVLKCFALKVTDMYSLLYLFFVLFFSCCGTVLIADACFFRGPSCKSV